MGRFPRAKFLFHVFVFTRRVFQPAVSGGASAPPWPSSRGVPAVPAARLGAFAGASLLHGSQRHAGFAALRTPYALLHRQVIRKGVHTLCSLHVLRQHGNSSWHFSSCSHPTPTESTVRSSFRPPLQRHPVHDLGCSRVDRLAHFAVTCPLGLENPFALALKKSQFRLQPKKKTHT